MNDLPVIEYHTSSIISNVEEIFKGVPWENIYETDWQETLAWLPKDRAVSTVNYLNNNNVVSSEFITFWGIVEVTRARTSVFKDKAFINVWKCDKSNVVPTEDIVKEVVDE